MSNDKNPWVKVKGYKDVKVNRSGEVLLGATGKVTKGGFAGRYRKVSVFPEGSDERELVYVHILVCTTFHGKPKEGQVVHHIDNDRGNNKADNLKWGSQSDNIKDAYSDGLISKEDYPSLNW